MKQYVTASILTGMCWIVSGCSIEASIHKSSLPAVDLSIDTPVANSYVNATNVSSYTVSGRCKEEGVTVTVSGDASGTATCTSGQWSLNLDFTAAAEGPLNLTAELISVANAGTTHSATITYTKDTVLPTVTLTNLTGGQLIKGVTLQNITWTAADSAALASSPIKIEYTSDNGATWLSVIAATANTSPYAWMVPMVDSTDVKVRLTATDAAGNTATDVSGAVFEIDSSGPVLTLTSLNGGEFVAGGSTTTDVTWTAADPNLAATPITIEYSKDNGTTWLPLVANIANAPASYTWPTVPSDNLATYRVRVTAVDTLGHTSEVVSAAAFTVDSTNPTVDTLVLNANNPTAGGNVLGFSLTRTDNFNVISAYRFSASTDFTASVWHTTLPASYTFPYAVGTSTARLYAQVRDAAGNISATFNSNQVTITMGMPPTIIFVEPTASNVYGTLGQMVHMSWAITTPSGNALNANGLSISYSLDNGTTILPWPGGAGANLLPTQNGGCTMDVGATGCVDLALPAALVNQRFSIIANVTDIASNSASAISTPQNKLGLKLIAGKNSSVLGQTGLAYALEYAGGLARDPQTGDLLIPQDCQIVILKANTGVVDKWSGAAADCNSSGDGGPVANARFTMTRRYGGGGAANIAFDSQRNVYWATRAGIWKYTRATGNAAIFVGPVNATLNADGTDRRSFGCDSITGGLGSCSEISFIEVGVDDSLYFVVDTQADPFSRKLYKVLADNTVKNIGGLKAASLPQPAAMADATAVGFRSYTIFPDKANNVDRIFGLGWGGAACTTNASCSQNGVWEINGTTGKTTLFSAISPAANTVLTRYLPSREAFGYMETGPCKMSFANPADAGQVIASMNYPTGDCDVSDVADGAEKNMYYTNNGFTNVFFTAANNTPVVYSGNDPFGGDGGPATQAQILSPRQVTMDNAGNYYFIDVGNSYLRKIDSTGIISSIQNVTSPYDLSLSSGPAATVYVANTADTDVFGLNNRPILDINNIAGGSQFFAAAYNTKPFAPAASIATNAKTELSYGAVGSGGYYSGSVAHDGTDIYIFMVEMRPGDYFVRSTIKKIDTTNGMSMTTVAGDPATSTFAASLASISGLQVLSNSAGQTSCGAGCADLSRSGIKVAGGVVFKTEENGYLYSVDTSTGTNTWALQATGLNSTFAIDPSNQNMYYFVGMKLYRKVYTSTGMGAETEIEDFTGALKAPVIQNFDFAHPNTLILVDQNSIYTYTNATGIP